MPKKKKMTRQGVFAVWSGILALSALLSVVQDFNPEYRGVQKGFEKLTIERASTEIESANAKIEAQYKKRLADVDSKIRAATDTARSVNHAKVIAAKEAELKELSQKNYESGQAVSFAKSLAGAYRSTYEFLKNDPYATKDEVAAAQKNYDKNFAEVLRLQPVADAAYQAQEKAKAELKELQKGADDFKRERDQIIAEKKAWQEEVERIKPTDIVKFTANQVRDIPLLDFINPRYNLKQIVLEDLPDITKAAKVDRCITCHLGITDPKYDDKNVPMVYRTHPNLDLYLSTNSPHPIDKFGCTTCHLGRGYGSTFRLATHTPNNEEQAKEWKKKYGWDEHDSHYWDYPMLPKKNMEAMCVTCHPSTQEIKMAKDVRAGRRIYERRGCHGCHKIDGVSDDMKKIGPSLKNVAAKLDGDWMPRWIAEPRKFYDTARMPHAFGHLIPSHETFPEFMHHLKPEDAHELEAEHEVQTREESVQVRAISTWLLSQTNKDFESQLVDPPAEEGDAKAGKELVSKVNCLGCHKLDDLKAVGQGYGPDLSKIGTKTNRKWLYNWLKDPKKYWPDGEMPNPRLNDKEANDIAAYLMTLRDDAYTSAPLPAVDEKVLEQIAVRFKRAKLPEAEAKAEIAAMTPEQRALYVGEESMYRRGCFGCHDIKGYENRARIGTELTAEGFKEIELFDFGMHKFVHIPHFRHEWIEQKVKQPGTYFLGKVTNPYEQTFNMPWFGFNDKEAQQIASYVLGQTGKAPPAKYRYELAGTQEQIVAKQAMIRGSKIIERRNCQGCHPIGLGWEYMDSKDAVAGKEMLWLTDPLIAHFDPNLPEGKYSKVSQVKADEIKIDAETGKPKDKIVVPQEGFVVRSSQAIFGEDYLSMSDILGETPAEVDVGATDGVKVKLERPETVRIKGSGEGYIAQYYSEAALAPPVLRREGAKVNPEWFFKFLKKVDTIRNHIEPLRMPQWEWTDEEATDVVKYFSVAAKEPFPYQTTIHAELGDEHKSTAKELFGLPGTPDYDKSLKCLSCHPTGDLKPTNPKESWGPDLYLAEERLKTSFVQSWLTNPQGWAPGTKMPNFFFDKDGDKVIEVHPTPLVEQLGSPEAIRRLAEMIHYLPHIEEVKVAVAAAAEAQKNAPKPVEDEEFMEDGEGGGSKSSEPEEFIEE